MSENEVSKTELSVIIIAGDEEDNIAECLQSVDWADERIVICSSRSDRTMEIAEHYATQVQFRDFDSFAGQKQFALDLATREWVLSLDADERVTSELRDEITRILVSAEAKDGYTIPRKNFYAGTWLRHGGWYPDRQLRLFRKSAVRLIERLVHESFHVRGSVGELHTHMLHYTLPDIGHLLRKNLKYSSLEALEKHKKHRVGPATVLLRPPLEFLLKYFIRGGFLDGWAGFVVATIHSMNKMQMLLQMWEMQRRQGERKDES